MPKAGPVQIVWFKRDLRVADHTPLVEASARGPVLPLYIVEPEYWQEPDASARQWAFVVESLVDLQQQLGALGQPLVIRIGDAVQVLRAIHAQFGISALWSHEETGNGWTYTRDKRVAAWARGAGIAWHERRQTGVVRRLASRNGWAKAWDRDMAQPILDPPRGLAPLDLDAGQIPSAKSLGLAPDLCPHRQTGTRQVALDTLHSFLTLRGREYRYQMSSPVTAFDASSRMSPHLTWGTISMREVAQHTWARMRELKAQQAEDTRAWRASMVSFSGRQHWHCHFMQKLEDEPRLEFENLHRAYNGMRPEIADAAKLSAWEKGETGFPFVDACMRALAAHGWINFRMRAMLTSFASYHLWLPWRDSGLHLARQFTDYEPGIHWSQIQMQSGTTGINTMRIYNPVKQGYDQDAEGRFVRAWVPELAEVPDAFVHEPWRWDGAGSVLGKTYPEPIVENAAAARAAREALSAVRKGSGHREVARKIADKHGSRKSGVPMTGRRKPAPKESPQMSFDL
jgi:deoxyribodipyrimidine photo-lyase